MKTDSLFRHAVSLGSLLAGALSVLWLSHYVIGSLGTNKELILTLITGLVASALGFSSKFIAEGIRHLSPSRRVFLSSSWKDKEFTGQLTERLQAKGFKVWVDTQLRPGEQWEGRIRQALKDADIFLIVLSKDSKDSPWHKFELEYAKELKEGPRIIPLLLEESEIPADIKGYFYVDASHDRQAGMERVVQALG